MVEITKKYKIGTRRFGLINWIGAWTLYQKETLRFLNVWAQTLFSPLISSLLFLLVLSLAIGAERGDVLGVSFISFLSGTFYTVDRLPSFIQAISEFNPFFYMIDGFRYSFIGKADGSITIGLIYLSILSLVTWFVTYLLDKKGYKIKS